MKKIPSISTGFLVISLALVSIAVAQTTTPGGRLDAIRDFRTQRKDTREDLRSNVQSTHEETRTEVKNERVDTRLGNAGLTPQQIEERRRQMHQDIQETRDTMHQNIKKLRDEAKIKIESYRKELHDKLASMRDERKKNLVERLDKRLDEIHDKFVDHFTKVLDRLDEILARIQSRADKAAATGKDVSRVTTAITAARPLIDAARAKVQEFAGKTYPLNITTEDKLGPAVSASRRALHEDIQKVRDAVVAARKAIGDAAFALRNITNVDDDDREGGEADH